MKLENWEWINNFLEKRHYSQDQLNDDFTYKRKTLVQALADLSFKLIHSIKLLSAADTRLIILFFVLWLFSLAVLFLFKTDGYFFSNLYPELFGFGIEGLLLSGLLTYIIEKKANLDKEKIRLSLRELLVPYLYQFMLFKKPEEKYKADVNNPETVYYLITMFPLNFSIDKSRQARAITFINDYSILISSKIELFVPIMAQLKPDLMNLTLKLDNVIRKLCNRNISTQELAHTVIDLLGILIELDEENFTGYKIRKNIQQLMNLEAIANNVT